MCLFGILFWHAAMTVIITTHYIEESRNADNLAFMRFGRILSQDSPDNLLAKFNCTILEDVFLKLCQLDCGEIKQKYSVKKKKPHTSGGDIYGTKKKKSRMNHLTVNSSRMKALLFKNVTNLKRNPLALFFFLILPVIQIVLFCSSLYKKPDNLPVSVYNGDNKVLSKRFLSLLDTDKLSVSDFSLLCLQIVLSIRLFCTLSHRLRTAILTRNWCRL